MEYLNNIFNWIKSVWNEELFKLGEASFSLGSIAYLIFSLVLLIYVTGKIKQFLINKVFTRYSMNIGVSHSIATIIRYLLVTIGFFVVFQASGIDLSTLGILLGALGIGIGFGLQNITNNFVSGIVILFERPIKEGDRIEVGGTHGKVLKISARATTILTNDNIAIIVPNSEFISNRVINWSYNDDSVRFRVPVSVAYKSDVLQVKELLLEVAAENTHVLEQPAPSVRLTEFGDNGIELVLLVWTSSLIHNQGRFKSDINFGIYKKLKEYQIEIPYPQRDLHLKSGFEKISEAE
jgi:small-conductance mechanosensitive channel